MEICTEAEALEDWADDPREAARFARYQEETYRPSKSRAEDHYPKTDAEAKQLIERLNHFEWDTHQVRGRFDRNPYKITATLNGRKHCIHLPGRFGGVLRWLDQKERSLANAC